jgi:hypothetical protein
MNFPQEDEMIEQLFREFLADQEAHLSPESYGQYAYIIDLFEFYLERCQPGHRRQEYGATAQPDGISCGLFGAEDLPRGFSKFLGDFLPHEMSASTETLRTARTVIKALGAWLAAKGYVTPKKIARKRVDRASYDLLATQNFLDLFPD